MTKAINQETLYGIVSEAVRDALTFQGWDRKPLGSCPQHYYEQLYKRLSGYCGLDGYAMFSRCAETKEDCLQMWLDVLNRFWISDLAPENGLDWDATCDRGLERLKSRCCMRDGMRAVAENSLDEAEDSFRQAAADPDMREARQFLGYVLLELGKYGEARDAFQRQLVLDEGFALPPTPLGIGLATLYGGDADGAVRLANSMDGCGSHLDVLKEEIEWYRRQLSRAPEYRMSPNQDRLKDLLYFCLVLAAKARLD